MFPTKRRNLASLPRRRFNADVVQEKMSKAIEKAIQRDDWPRARALIRSALKQEPESHWLITRLGSTYYEQKQYKRALHYSEKALALAPNCPLVLWDYACTLEELNRTKEALSIYCKLIRRGVKSIANGECGEGNAWARGLVADCHYRSAHCHRVIGDRKRAAKSYHRHLALRGPGCRSIYPISDVRRQLQVLTEKTAQQSN